MNLLLSFCKIASFIALCALLGALTAAAIEIRDDARMLTPKAASALSSVQSIAKSTSEVEEATYATEGAVANLADSVNTIAAGLASHEASELKQTQLASSKLNGLIDHADLDVTGFGSAEQATINTINGIGTDSHATLEAARDVLSQASTQVSNPAIAASLEDIRASAANVKTSTAQIDTTTQDLSATASDVRQVADHWRATAMAPVSTAKRIGLAVASFAGAFAGHFF